MFEHKLTSCDDYWEYYELEVMLILSKAKSFGFNVIPFPFRT